MDLLLNFSPIEFDDAEIEAGVFSYGEDGQSVLEQLRQQHWATHVFRRQGPDRIVAVAVTADAPSLTQATTKLTLKENLGLAASLIRNSILNTLTSLGRTVLSYEPLRFIARDDLLRACIHSRMTCPDWLGVKLLYELAIRPVYFLKHKPFIAAILDVRTTRIVDIIAADLMESGLSLVGHYVTRRVKAQEDPRIASTPELLGRVTTVNGQTLTLTDSSGGVASVQANEVRLEKRAFAACLAHAFPECNQTIAAALEKAVLTCVTAPIASSVSAQPSIFLLPESIWPAPVSRLLSVRC